MNLPVLVGADLPVIVSFYFSFQSHSLTFYVSLAFLALLPVKFVHGQGENSLCLIMIYVFFPQMLDICMPHVVFKY